MTYEHAILFIVIILFGMMCFAYGYQAGKDIGGKK